MNAGSYQLVNEGTLFLFLFHDELVRGWFKDNVDAPSHCWLGNIGCAVEARFAGNIVEGLSKAGILPLDQKAAAHG